MVVVTIIAILAALIVPALQRAQARAMASNCMGKAKAIAGSISTYASSWDGWTNPDSEYYVALMGYKIDIPGSVGTGWATPGYFGEPPGWASSSTTASYKYAQSEVKTFRCPIDDAPTTTKHAVKSSYKIGSTFAGKNIMNLTSDSDQTLILSEVGRRHPVGTSGTEGHFVYADLHSTLGYTGPAIQGAWVRMWEPWTTNYLTQAATKTGAPTPRYEELYYAGNWDMEGPWILSCAWGKLGTASNNWWWQSGGTWWSGTRPRHPEQITIRMDGLFQPPATGRWQFEAFGTDRVFYFAVGNAAVKPAVGFDTAPTMRATRADWTFRNFANVDTRMVSVDLQAGSYYPISMYHGWCCHPGEAYVRMRCIDPANGQVLSGYDAQPVAGKYVRRMP
jgi:type II secretory pathway pseudopilin PulG